MKRSAFNARRILAALALAASAPLCAQTAPAPEWTWRATIYLWGPSINGTANFKGLPGDGEIDTTVNTGGYLSRLQFAFMGTLEARRGPWSVFGDAIYLNFGNHASRVDSISGPGGNVPIPVDAGTTTNLEGSVATVAGAYGFMQQPGARADLLAGVRLARLRSSIDWEFVTPAAVVGKSGSTEAAKDFVDGIVGARGSIELPGQWFVPWYVDAGAGTSRLTWQAMGGVGYHFTWGDAILAYRHLAYDFHTNNFASDVKFSGPAVALAFKF